jgi:hypothetical protein
MFRPSLLIAVFVLSAAQAAAQVNTLASDNPRENARLRIGAVHFTPAISLKELGVDTNVFNEAGEPRRDFTATVTPEVQVWLPVARRGLLKLTLATDAVWYKEFASERSLDPYVTLRGETYLRRFTLFADSAFSHARQRPSDQPEIDVRSRRRDQTIRAGVDMRLTPKTSLEVHGRWSDLDWDADDSLLGSRLEQTLNRETTGFGAVARYRPTVLTTFELLAERFEDRFPLSPERDGDNVRIMPGVRFEPRALINGFARIGVRHLNPVDETILPEFKGLVSDFGLSYTLFGATTIGVSHTRDVRYSFELTQPYYVDTGVGARVRRALGPRFDVIASAHRNRLAYEELIAEGRPPAPERIDTVWNYGGSLGYRFGRTGRIGLGVTYWTRNSTTHASREYEGLRIGTTATYGF